DCNHRNMRGLEINIKDAWNIVRAQLSHVCRAQDRRRHIPFEHGKRVSRLRTVNHLQAFLFQRIRETLGKENIAVDQQDLGRRRCKRAHALPSAEICSRSMTSTTSPPTSITPRTYDDLPLTSSSSEAASSHSPVTGSAVHSLEDLPLRAVIR